MLKCKACHALQCGDMDDACIDGYACAFSCVHGMMMVWLLTCMSLLRLFAVRSWSLVQSRCLSDTSDKADKGGKGRGKGAANLFIQKAQQRVFDDRVCMLAICCTVWVTTITTSCDCADLWTGQTVEGGCDHGHSQGGAEDEAEGGACGRAVRVRRGD
jgi:hypothetical protein